MVVAEKSCGSPFFPPCSFFPLWPCSTSLFLQPASLLRTVRTTTTETFVKAATTTTRTRERGQEGEGTQLGDQERKEVNDVLGRRKQRRSTTLISSFLSPKVPSSLLTLLCTLFTREDEDYRISRQRREPTSA